jgi:hypothetical protein
MQTDMTMAKTGKYLFIAIGALVLIAVVSIWLVISNLDSIVKDLVETVGTETLDTPVSLDAAEITLGEATAVLRGLAVANPPGYDTRNAFELAGIAVTIDPGSVTTNEIVLPRVAVDQMHLTFEQVGGNNNLQTLLDSLDDSASEPAEETVGEPGEEVLLVIEEFLLAGAGMTIIHDQLGEPVTIKLPDMRLTNIGRAGAPVTAEEAARQILEPILQRAEDAAVDRAKAELEARAEEEIDKQKDRAKDKAVRKLFGD